MSIQEKMTPEQRIASLEEELKQIKAQFQEMIKLALALGIISLEQRNDDLKNAFSIDQTDSARDYVIGKYYNGDAIKELKENGATAEELSLFADTQMANLVESLGFSYVLTPENIIVDPNGPGNLKR